MDQVVIRNQLEALQASIREHRAASGEASWFLTHGPAPALPSDKLRACRVLGARSQLFEQLDRPTVIAETGTHNGAFALELLEKLDPLRLTCFDSNFANLDLDSLAVHMDRLKLRAGKPWVQLRTFPRNSFDLLVAGGLDKPDAARKILVQALRTVKRGGLILCLGFSSWTAGSMRPLAGYKAICEFVVDNDVELAFLVLQPMGYHDVVLRVVNK